DHAGKVWCWGDNRYGQLGSPDPQQSTRPIVVAGLGKATELQAAKTHTCALTSDGGVWCWGFDGEGATGKPRARWIAEPRPAELPTPARRGTAPKSQPGSSGRACQ